MRIHIIFALLTLAGTFSYAQTPLDTAIFEIQKIALKVGGKPESVCKRIIKDQSATLSQALEVINDYNYFKDGLTIKLLELDLYDNYLRGRIASTQIPSPLLNTFLGIEPKLQESSELAPEVCPTGNNICCTFTRECTDKKHEQLIIAFYQIFEGEYKDLGTYSHETTANASMQEYQKKLALAGLMQALSAITYQAHTPSSSIHQPIASFTAFITTYLLLTPYDFLSGASMNFSELTQEFGTFILALAGNIYVNPTSLRNSDATILWLTYIVLGSLQSCDLWYLSNEKIESAQQWIDQNAGRLISAALGAEFIAIIFQIIEYQYLVYQCLVYQCQQEIAIDRQLLITDVGARAAEQYFRARRI